jgi:hypothetical protein
MLSTQQLQKIYNSEKVLMVLISRLYFETEDAGQVQNFIDQAGIDWDLLYKITRVHDVRSFIYHIISTRKLKVDADFEARLKKDSLSIGFQNLHQLNFAKELLNDLASRGIKAIPYKGVNFGSKYYESIFIRESSDVDLLVDRNSAKQIRKYFHDHHFLAKSDIPDGYLNYVLFLFRELTFKTPKDKLNINCSVEIQWRLMEPYVGRYVSFSYFEKQLDDNTVDAFKGLNATNDMICMASHHFIKEPLIRFKYVIDAACLLKTGGKAVDHEVITKLLKKYDYQNLYGAALYTINDLLGIEVGAVHLSPTYRNNEILLNSCLAFPTVKKLSPYNKPILKLIWDQHNLKGKADMAMRMLLHSFLPSLNDFKALNLPPFLLPLVVILRPFRLFYSRIVKNSAGRIA